MMEDPDTAIGEPEIKRFQEVMFNGLNNWLKTASLPQRTSSWLIGCPVSWATTFHRKKAAKEALVNNLKTQQRTLDEFIGKNHTIMLVAQKPVHIDLTQSPGAIESHKVSSASQGFWIGGGGDDDDDDDDNNGLDLNSKSNSGLGRQNTEVCNSNS